MTETEIKKELEDLLRGASEAIKDGDDSPEIMRNKEALETALDILDDYEKQGKLLQSMMERFEKVRRPRKDYRLGIFLCPRCNGRVNFHQGFCQKCGQRLSAERYRPRRSRNREEEDEY